MTYAPTDARKPSAAMLRMRDCIAEMYQVTPEEIEGHSRLGYIVQARQVTCWVLHHCIVGISYSMISKLVGDRDHSTVIHACRKVDRMREDDPQFRALTDAICEAIGQRDFGAMMGAPSIERVRQVAIQFFQQDLEQPEPLQPLNPELLPPTPVDRVLSRKTRDGLTFRHSDLMDRDSGAAEAVSMVAASDALLRAIKREGVFPRILQPRRAAVLEVAA